MAKDVSLRYISSMVNNPLAVGLRKRRRPKPFTLVVFGVTGDLAQRKLFPALYALYEAGELDDWRLIGIGRRAWTDEVFRERITASLADDEGGTSAMEKSDDLAVFLAACSYLQGDFDDAELYTALASVTGMSRCLVHYLATPPESYERIIARLGHGGLGEGWAASSRIVVEKPFGRDASEAEALNRLLEKVFHETNVFRIDHYLGKETVQNIAVSRFANALFEPVWNNRYIAAVEISVVESVGVETRAAYYERSGALRDMVQNHLFQLMALIAMEPPSSFDADAVRAEKVKVLRALKPIPDNRMALDSVRGQYGAGLIDGDPVPGYLQERGVASDSMVETYAALRLEINSWRWAGVPFLLRTGKRLPRRLSEIAIHFKKPPLSLFPLGYRGANQLVFRIQPEEGLTLYLNTKIPGLVDRVRSISMDFLYGTGFGSPSPEAYERLLLDAIVGDGTLFIRRDEAAASWAFIDPIRSAWDSGAVPLALYDAGSSGPSGALALPGEGRWRRL